MQLCPLRASQFYFHCVGCLDLLFHGLEGAEGLLNGDGSLSLFSLRVTQRRFVLQPLSLGKFFVRLCSTLANVSDFSDRCGRVGNTAYYYCEFASIAVIL